MRDQLKEVIDMFTLSEGQEINETVRSPAQKHLREVNPNGVRLGKEKIDSFHSIVHKLLWIMKRVRPDLETSVSFLCTRVSKSDEDG